MKALSKPMDLESITRRSRWLDSPAPIRLHLREIPSAASDVAQYRGSSRSGESSIGDRDTSSDEAGVHTDVGSVLEKPATIHIGSLGAQVTQLSVTGENPALPIAPSILSSTGGVVDQPTEGAPALGSLDIKARPRVDRSLRAYSTRSFTNTTFGQLLEAMTTRKMEPFMFRKIGTAYLGCRDGVSQAAAAWHADNFLTDMVCIEQPRKHFYDLLPWKYSWPTIFADLSDEDIEDPNPPLIRGLKTTD
ncbi:hypothetical protein EDD16DRAFT_1577784 [Pisolithus croceorrhizus]|nr:hypothetical protein EDD16DRAFT_1577784 [Pisolithus croceorrhizus]KAI6122122.1 hypothetical protein EV401DRAFT_1952615 [Pisolithus croceorrhizus]KAI6163455.1 hypothetical protein EDD17DRAFT_1567462 [Pisolithus thermaeus]